MIEYSLCLVVHYILQSTTVSAGRTGSAVRISKAFIINLLRCLPFSLCRPERFIFCSSDQGTALNFFFLSFSFKEQSQNSKLEFNQQVVVHYALGSTLSLSLISESHTLFFLTFYLLFFFFFLVQEPMCGLFCLFVVSAWFCWNLSLIKVPSALQHFQRGNVKIFHAIYMLKTQCCQVKTHPSEFYSGGLAQACNSPLIITVWNVI